MPKHIDIILTEMFRRVNAEFTPDFTKAEAWYYAYEWTREEEQEFVDWLSDYLFHNKEARHEIMNFPIRNKNKCRNAAMQFNAWFGWRTKPTS